MLRLQGRWEASVSHYPKVTRSTRARLVSILASAEEKMWQRCFSVKYGAELAIVLKDWWTSWLYTQRTKQRRDWRRKHRMPSDTQWQSHSHCSAPIVFTYWVFFILQLCSWAECTGSDKVIQCVSICDKVIFQSWLKKKNKKKILFTAAVHTRYLPRWAISRVSRLI